MPEPESVQALTTQANTATVRLEATESTFEGHDISIADGQGTENEEESIENSQPAKMGTVESPGIDASNESSRNSDNISISTGLADAVRVARERWKNGHTAPPGAEDSEANPGNAINTFHAARAQWKKSQAASKIPNEYHSTHRVHDARAHWKASQEASKASNNHHPVASDTVLTARKAWKTRQQKSASTSRAQTGTNGLNSSVSEALQSSEMSLTPMGAPNGPVSTARQQWKRNSDRYNESIEAVDSEHHQQNEMISIESSMDHGNLDSEASCSERVENILQDGPARYLCQAFVVNEEGLTDEQLSRIRADLTPHIRAEISQGFVEAQVVDNDAMNRLKKALFTILSTCICLIIIAAIIIGVLFLFTELFQSNVIPEEDFNKTTSKLEPSMISLAPTPFGEATELQSIVMPKDDNIASTIDPFVASFAPNQPGEDTDIMNEEGCLELGPRYRFGSELTASYLNQTECLDTNTMLPITIHFFYTDAINISLNEIKEHNITLECNETIMLMRNEERRKNDYGNKTILLKEPSFCRIIVEGTEDKTYSYEVLLSNKTSNVKTILTKGDGVALDQQYFFAMPGCWINSMNGFQKVATWVNSDMEQNSISCKFYKVQRFVMAVLAQSWKINQLVENTWMDMNSHECDWEPGIDCKGNGWRRNLTEISLYGKRLVGSIPSEIGLLSTLVHLSLNSNKITGTLPSEIGLLSDLVQLKLRFNSIIGTLPTEIGLLSALVELDLGLNEMNSTLPSEIGLLSVLEQFKLNSNEITGTLPSEIGLLSSLEYLKLGWNQIIGTIPSEIGNLSYLIEFKLEHNQISGSILKEFSNLQPVRFLYLDNNLMTGSIIPSIGNLTNLFSLHLDNNIFTGLFPTQITELTKLAMLFLENNMLSGPLPTLIGSLTKLRKLSLHQNQFTGTIPNEIGNLSSMISSSSCALDLSYNQLTGSIPSQLGILTGLEMLFLHHNMLNGTIPSQIGNLINLEILQLENNLLTGLISTKIGNLTKLSELHLQSNMLNGPLPTFIGNLERLRKLNLHHNQVAGTIPSEIGKLSTLGHSSRSCFSCTLDLSHNQLTGSIPSQLGHLTELGHLQLNHNRLNGTIPKQIGNLINLNVMDFNQNQLTGSIPRQINNLTKLDYLYLNKNLLTGSFPSDIGHLTNLYTINLSDNWLNGSLPTQIGSMSNLAYLYSSHNQLSGTIPTCIINLPRLRGLFLNNNTLTGLISSQLGSIQNCMFCEGLYYLDLSSNMLKGSISTAISKLTNMHELSLGYNVLTGTIPTQIGNMIDLNYLYLNNNNLTGTIPTEISSIPQLHRLRLNGNKLTEDVTNKFCLNETTTRPKFCPLDCRDGHIPVAIELVPDSSMTLTFRSSRGIHWNLTVDGVSILHGRDSDSGKVCIPMQSCASFIIHNKGFKYSFSDTYYYNLNAPFRYSVLLGNETITQSSITQTLAYSSDEFTSRRVIFGSIGNNCTGHNNNY